MKKKNVFEVAEFKLVYKSWVDIKDLPLASNSQDAYKIFLDNWSDQIEFVEECYALYLNGGNRVVGIYHVSKGGHSRTIIDPKIVFTAALKCRARALILAHNHPSGRSFPSEADKALTKKIVDGGKLLDITVLDHIIVTPYGYYSFSDEGGM